jgi:integrase
MATIEKRRQRRGDRKLGPVRWRVRYRDPQGRQKSKSFRKRTQAEKFLIGVEATKLRGEYVDDARLKQPYGPWAREWLRGLRKMGEARRKNAESMLETHILPTFDRVPLGDIDDLMIREWANKLAHKPSPRGGTLSGWHLGAIRGLFLRSLRAAAAARLLSPSVAAMAADAIEFPSPIRKRERFLTHAEAEHLIAGQTDGIAHLDPSWRPFHYGAVWTGCRWGELAGLLRDNLDLDQGELHVRTVVARVSSGHYELKPVPKNDYSLRTVDLPEPVVEILKFHLAAARDSDLVFPNSKGGVMSYRNFRERVFDPAVERSGFAPLTFHDLRHTHCAWLIDLGWSEFHIVRRMGWKDGRMLHSTYGHLLNRRNREAIEGLEKHWSDATGAADPRLL